MFLLDRRDWSGLFAQQYPVSNVRRHSLIAVKETFEWPRHFPAFAFAVVFGWIDLQWPDLAEYGINHRACGAGEDEAVHDQLATHLARTVRMTKMTRTRSCKR